MFALTIVLIIITGFYAWQTRRMASLMEAAQRAMIMPLLVPRLVAAPDLPNQVVLVIRNVGAGPAIGLSATLRILPGSMRFNIESTLIPAGEELVVRDNEHRPFLRYQDKLKELGGELHLKGSCHDSAGQQCTIDRHVPLGESCTIPVHEMFLEQVPDIEAGSGQNSEEQS